MSSAINKEVIDRLTPWLLANVRSEDLDAKDMHDYVVSLISAPGTQEELYQRCLQELEEFLGPQTQPFVNALFQQIAAISQGEQAPQAQAQSEQEQQQQVQQQVQQQQQQQPQELQGDAPMSGGQDEFRRNFRGDFPAFSQTAQVQNSNHNHNQNQFGRPDHSQGPAPFGFPNMPSGFPPGFPPFPPPNAPPAFGFQGFGRPRYNNNGNNYQRGGDGGGNYRQPQKRVHSHLASINNEHSVANKRLVVEHIPSEHLKREQIEEYFSKFGKLKFVEIHARQGLAEIEFETHDQAVQAHKCPDPIFGNRFVKVFWRKHSPDDEPQLDIEEVRRMQAIKQQQFEEKEAKRKELTANLRAVMKEQADILQQRQSMLQSGQVDAEMQADMQTKSEVLSTKLKELKQQLTALQSPSAAGPTRGGGVYRGRGGSSGSPYSRGGRAPRGGSYRGAYAGSFKFQGASLDRRPKGVLVDGITPEKDETLRGELASRNYSDYQRKSDNSVIIEFSDRKEAEEFFNNDIPELGDVKKSWVRTEPKQGSEDATMS